MPYIKKKYKNGQSRNTGQNGPSKIKRNKKNYADIAIRFHGGEKSYNAFVERGRSGYSQAAFMKIWVMIVLAILGLGLFASSAYSAEPEPAKPAATDYKEAFLQFALEKAEKYSSAAENTVEKTVEVAMREAPELAKEYLAWKFWESFIYLVMHVSLTAVSGLLAFILIKAAIKAHNDGAIIGFTISGALTGIASLISVIALFVDGTRHMATMAQIHLAPRVYLIEQLRELVK